MKTDFVALKIEFSNLRFFLANGEPLLKIIPCVKSLFKILACDAPRSYRAEGYMKLNNFFEHLYNEFFTMKSSEQMEAFADRFFDFLDDAFPEDVDEEVGC